MRRVLSPLFAALVLVTSPFGAAPSRVLADTTPATQALGTATSQCHDDNMTGAMQRHILGGKKDQHGIYNDNVAPLINGTSLTNQVGTLTITLYYCQAYFQSAFARFLYTSSNTAANPDLEGTGYIVVVPSGGGAQGQRTSTTTGQLKLVNGASVDTPLLQKPGQPTHTQPDSWRAYFQIQNTPNVGCDTSLHGSQACAAPYSPDPGTVLG